MSLYHLSEEIKKWTVDEIIKRQAQTADEAIDYRKYFSVTGFFEDYLEDYVKLTVDEVQGQQDPSASQGSELMKMMVMNDMAITEKRKADEKIMRVTKKQKRQNELFHQKIIELEAKLDKKQEVEKHIQRIRSAIKVIKLMIDEEQTMLESIEKELRDKEEEFDSLKSLHQDLIIKERKTNDELREARNQLINNEMAIMEPKKDEEKLL